MKLIQVEVVSNNLKQGCHFRPVDWPHLVSSYPTFLLLSGTLCPSLALAHCHFQGPLQFFKKKIEYIFTYHNIVPLNNHCVFLCQISVLSLSLNRSSTWVGSALNTAVSKFWHSDTHTSLVLAFKRVHVYWFLGWWKGSLPCSILFLAVVWFFLIGGQNERCLLAWNEHSCPSFFTILLQPGTWHIEAFSGHLCICRLMFLLQFKKRYMLVLDLPFWPVSYIPIVVW